MHTHTRLVLGGLVTAAMALAAGAAAAQDPPPSPPEPQVLYACYVPSAGVVYRIREAGLPTECRSPAHTLFSWNQTGPAGAPGAPGAAGAAGPAGLSCWDTNGNGQPDPAEDRNGDEVFDGMDCQGPQGPAGAAGVIGWEVVWQVFSVAGQSIGSGTAICPAGKRPLGGGFQYPWNPLDPIVIVASMPSITPPFDRWELQAVNHTATPIDVWVFAVCANWQPLSP